jgi:hypothetical protein
MSTNLRWPEPPSNLEPSLGSYLRELIRTLGFFDTEIFSQDSGLIFNTSRIRPFVEVSTAYAAGINDSVILADASASNVRITLPEAVSVKGTFYDIKRTDTGGFVVSVEGSGSELPVVLTGASRPSVTLYSDGTRFWII